MEHAQISHRKANALAELCGQHHIISIGADFNTRDHIAIFKLHSDFAALVDGFKFGEFVASHVARTRGEHDIHGCPRGLILRHWHNGGDAFAHGERQKIDHGLAA